MLALMLLQTVIEDVYSFLIPKFIKRMQPTVARWSGRFNKMNGALCALHVLSTIPPGELSAKA